MKLLLILLPALLAAQTAFEVASIKPDDSGGNYIEAKPGALNAHSATVATCIMWAYALTLDKNGPKFHSSEGDGESSMQAASKLSRRWTFTTMPQLANSLADAMQAPVLDETGLPGKYDISLDLSPYLPSAGERPDIAAMMVTAVREQLGIKLEPRRAAAEVLVIDHLEKPAAN